MRYEASMSVTARSSQVKGEIKFRTFAFFGGLKFKQEQRIDFNLELSKI